MAPMVRAEDVEEAALVAVDSEFVRDVGPDMWHWQPWQREQYLAAIDQAHAEFGTQAVAS